MSGVPVVYSSAALLVAPRCGWLLVIAVSPKYLLCRGRGVRCMIAGTANERLGVRDCRVTQQEVTMFCRRVGVRAW
jgi:hypothetical protein